MNPNALAVEHAERSESSPTTITMICMYCKCFMGTVDGEGVFGASHGICINCMPNVSEEIRRMNG